MNYFVAVTLVLFCLALSACGAPSAVQVESSSNSIEGGDSTGEAECGTQEDCTDRVPKNCDFKGVSLAHGSTANGFTTSTVPFSGSCDSFKTAVSCFDGVLTPSGAFRDCRVEDLDLTGTDLTDFGKVNVNFKSTQSKLFKPAATDTWIDVQLVSDGSFYLTRMPLGMTEFSANWPYANSQIGLVIYQPRDSGFTLGFDYFIHFAPKSVGVKKAKLTLKTATQTVVLGLTGEGLPMNTSGQCNIAGWAVSEGFTLIGFRDAAAEPGKPCRYQRRTCTGGKLTGTYNQVSCHYRAPGMRSALLSMGLFTNSMGQTSLGILVGHYVKEGRLYVDPLGVEDPN